MPGAPRSEWTRDALPVSAMSRLPPPRVDALQQVLRARRSVRDLEPSPLRVADVADVLWAAAGQVGTTSRTVPSACTSYPVSLYLAAGDIDGVVAGLHRYEPAGHRLELVVSGDVRPALARATIDATDWLGRAPAVLVLTGHAGRAREAVADQPAAHGEHFLWMEAGLAAQNVSLMAPARGLATVLVAGLDDDVSSEVGRRLLPADERIMGLMPLGLARASAAGPWPAPTR